MQAELKSQDRIIRDEWDALIRRSPQGNFFAATYYMDVVAPGWMGIEVFDNNRLVAVMPLNPKRKYGMAYSLQPPFVQHWGVFFDDVTFEKSYTEYRWKRKVLEVIIAALPDKVKLFGYGFAPEFDYGLPFHWMGCNLRTRYTYRLDVGRTEEEVFAGLKKKKKHLIRRAEKEFELSVAKDNGAGLVQLIDENLASGNQIMGQEHRNLVGKIVETLAEDGSLVEARNSSGELVSAGYVVHFEKKSTFLLSAKKAAGGPSGAQALVLWEAIRRSIGEGRIFDFEGSMIEGIELFFRGYGAVPKPYLFIEKNDLPLLVKWIRNLR